MSDPRRMSQSRRAFLKAAALAAAGAAGIGDVLRGWWRGGPRPGVTTAEVKAFTRQFAWMLQHSGQPLAPILDHLAEQQPNPRLRQVLVQVNDEVLLGNTLSSA